MSAISTSSDEIFLSWEPPPEEDQNGIIIGYNVNVNDSYDEVVYELSIVTTNLSVQALEAYTTYKVQVAPFTEFGEGPYSNVVMVTTYQSGTILNVTIAIIKRCVWSQCVY